MRQENINKKIPQLDDSEAKSSVDCRVMGKIGERFRSFIYIWVHNSFICALKHRKFALLLECTSVLSRGRVGVKDRVAPYQVIPNGWRALLFIPKQLSQFLPITILPINGSEVKHKFNKGVIVKNIKSKIILLILAVSLIGGLDGFAQTLNQEYKTKQDYKKANITMDENRTVLTVFGKDFTIEETYYSLKYAIMKNGDYICILDGDSYTWQYMEQIAREENRYKVCLQGGSSEVSAEGIYRRLTPSIWVLRKNR